MPKGEQIAVVRVIKDDVTYFFAGNGEIEMYEARKCGYQDIAQFLGADGANVLPDIHNE